MEKRKVKNVIMKMSRLVMKAMIFPLSILPLFPPHIWLSPVGSFIEVVRISEANSIKLNQLGWWVALFVL